MNILVSASVPNPSTPAKQPSLLEPFYNSHVSTLLDDRREAPSKACILPRSCHDRNAPQFLQLSSIFDSNTHALIPSSLFLFLEMWTSTSHTNPLPSLWEKGPVSKLSYASIPSMSASLLHCIAGKGQCDPAQRFSRDFCHLNKRSGVHFCFLPLIFLLHVHVKVSHHSNWSQHSNHLLKEQKVSPLQEYVCTKNAGSTRT